MNKTYWTFLIVVMVTLPSCFSSVCVRVHSLDMDKMKKSPEFSRMKNEQKLKNYKILLNGGYFEQLGNRIVQTVADSLKNVRNIDSATKVNIIKNIVPPKVKKEMAKVKESTVAARDALDNYLESPLDNLKKEYDTAFANLMLTTKAASQFLLELASEIPMKESFGIYLKAAFEKSNNEHGLTFTFGTSIADDAMASFITKAPEEYWQKYKSSYYTKDTDLSKSNKKALANVTKIVTFIGNSDIAVKMDGPANFVIKGVRLDADASFRTSFKVLGQAFKYMAIQAGLPGQLAESSSTTAPARIPEIQNLDNNKAQSQSLNDSYQALTDAFLKIVAAKRDDLLLGNAKTRGAAIDAIKDAYTFYKSQLPTQKPATP